MEGTCVDKRACQGVTARGRGEGGRERKHEGRDGAERREGQLPDPCKGPGSLIRTGQPAFLPRKEAGGTSGPEGPRVCLPVMLTKAGQNV